MYKLCFALAFLAVAAAKPNWPLSYSSYPALSSVYQSAAYPVPESYVAPVATPYSSYSAPVYSSPAYSPAAYSAPAYQEYPSVYAKAYASPVVAKYAAASVGYPAQVGYPAPLGYAPQVSYAAPTVFAKSVAAPIYTYAAAAPAVASSYGTPVAYTAQVAPVAAVGPVSGYSYGSPAAFAWKKK